MNIIFFRKRVGLLLLGLHFFSISLGASEFREPFLLANGPLRFLFEDPGDKISMRFWGATYNRFSDKVFDDKVGRNFLEFPSLLFGNSVFRVCEILPNCIADSTFSHYNPLLRTAKLRLKASYNELGVVIGGSIDCPFYSNGGAPGKVGLRVNIPFKRCSITKIDTGGVRAGAETQDVMMVRPMQRGTTPKNSTTTTLGSNDCTLIRLDFAEALVQNAAGESMINYHDPKDSAVKVGAVTISVPAATDVKQAPVGLINCPEGEIPVLDQNFADPSGTFIAFPADADTGSTTDSNVNSNAMYVFDQTVDYTLLSDQANKGREMVLADQENKASTWLIPFAQASTNNGITTLEVPTGGPLNTLQNRVAQIGQNVYEWFYSQEEQVSFESFYSDNIGDMRLEFFAEQTLSDRICIQLSGTLVLPTGGKASYKSNPYQIYPGNGGHWEVAPGATIAFKGGDFLTVKADARYHFVLTALEERAACFSGAYIKNIGPKAEANVKWRYFVGGIDVNFTHPRTAAITAMLGYQFYYKHKEVLTYTVDSMESWLGKKYDKTTESYATFLAPLDGDELAVQYTDAVSHKLRFETSFLLSGWVEFFCGGGWVFMGKNTPASIDGHFGFHIAF